jgi:hypothetical protein
MAVTIIVEDGSGVEDANSYVSVEDVRTYATQRGVTLPSDDDELAALVIKAADFIESFACDFQGAKTDCEQAMQWPRTGVVVCCNEIASNVIPKELKKAQCASVLAANEGIVLQPNITPESYVVEETVGPITTKFADPSKVGISPRFTGVDALLKPLFAASCGQAGLSLSTYRV